MNLTCLNYIWLVLLFFGILSKVLVLTISRPKKYFKSIYRLTVNQMTRWGMLLFVTHHPEKLILFLVLLPLQIMETYTNIDHIYKYFRKRYY